MSNAEVEKLKLNNDKVEEKEKNRYSEEEVDCNTIC